MKLLSIFILAMLIGVSSAFSSDAAPQRKCIRFVEKARNGSPEFQNQRLPKKAKRKSSQRGDIIITYDESVPDSMRLAINAAKDLWENKLPTKQPIHINVFSNDDLNDDILVAADILLIYRQAIFQDSTSVG